MSRSMVRWVRRGAVSAAVLLVVGFGVGSLTGSKQDDTAELRKSVDSAALTRSVAGYEGGPIGAPAPAIAADTSTGGAGTAGAAPGSDALKALNQIPVPESQVIKTGDVGLRVPKGRMDRAWQRVMDLAREYGGFVLSSGQGSRPIPLVEGGVRSFAPPEDGDDRFADIVIRVPADRFEQAVAALTNGELGEVTRRGFSGRDVTAEFVDLDSRLRHLRAQEAVLLRLMARATSIGDTITVQQQLSQIQLQIEEITGRVNYLKDQTRFATISVHLAEDGAIAAGDEPSFTKAWHTAIEGLERMATAALIGATWLSPFAVIALAWIVTRRVRRPATQP